MKTKLAAVALASAMAALTLTSCSPGAGGTSPSTITGWGYVAEDSQMLKDWENAFWAKNPDIKINYSYVAFDQLESKLIAAAASSTGPDFIIMNGGGTTNLVLGKAVTDMTAEWSKWADAGQFPEGAQHKYDGKLYSVQPYVNLLGLYYNKDILDKLNLQVPTTPDELEAAMVKAVAAGYQGMAIPGAADGQGEFSSHPWLTSAGFDYSKPTQEGLQAGLSIVENWISKGLVSKEASTWGNAEAWTPWMAGNTLFCQQGNWQLVNAAKATFKWGVAPLPLNASGGIYLGGEAVGIGAFTKNRAAVVAFIEDGALSKAGGLASLAIGSIPSRADLATDPKVTGDPNIMAYATAVAKFGAEYPDPGVKSESVAQAWVNVGQAWSSVMAGGSAAAATNTLWPVLKPMLVNG